MNSDGGKAGDPALGERTRARFSLKVVNLVVEMGRSPGSTVDAAIRHLVHS